jgi:hypothetical protein
MRTGGEIRTPQNHSTFANIFSQTYTIIRHKCQPETGARKSLGTISEREHHNGIGSLASNQGDRLTVQDTPSRYYVRKK